MFEPLAPDRRLGHAGPMPDPEVPERPARRRFTAEYKLRIVEEANAAIEPGQVGTLLRREGLYSSHLVDWRRQYRLGALSSLARPRGRPKPQPLAAETVVGGSFQGVTDRVVAIGGTGLERRLGGQRLRATCR